MLTFFKMLFLSIILQNVQLQETIDKKEVCYEGYGCFDVNPPFGSTNIRPVGFLPESPLKISTFFTLYTRENPSGELISLKEISSCFNPKHATKMIVHGFMQDGKVKWIKDMKDAFLRLDYFNVIGIDWSRGNRFPYTQAVANARVVGVDIAKLIEELVYKTGANLEDFHLIGHSLGGPVSGYAGERLNGKLGRITGLDSAGPYFEYTDNRVKLDSSDAKFVDLIHTDGSPTYKLGFGLLEPAGHVDFYPNGGYNQPNCPQITGKVFNAIFNAVTLNAGSIPEDSGCSHFSAHRFYTDSIENQNCSYLAFSCKSKEDFDQGKCLKCSDKGCNKMGYWASPSKETGSLYLNTQGAVNYPYCKFNYQIQLYSNNLSSMKQTCGKLTVVLKNSQSESNTQTIEDSFYTFNKDFISSHLVSLNSAMAGNIESISLYFKKRTNPITSWLYDNEWSFKYLDVFDAYKQKKFRFCPVNETIKNEETVEFLPCNQN